MDPETGGRHQQLTNGQGTWSAGCVETRTPGAAGGLGFAQSSRELKGLRDEPGVLHGSWTVRTLGFAWTGGVVLFGGGVQELSGDGGVSDGGVVADAEHGGEVDRVGSVVEGFFESSALACTRPATPHPSPRSAAAST
jgi:hypothetical protein